MVRLTSMTIAGLAAILLLSGGRSAAPARGTAPTAAIHETAVEAYADIMADLDRTDAPAVAASIPVSVSTEVRLGPDEIRLEASRFVLRHGRAVFTGSDGAKLSFELTSVKMGATPLFEQHRGVKIETARSGDCLVSNRGAVTEVYRAVGQEIEQAFVIHARPAGEGDLVVSGQAKTNLKAIVNTSDEIVLGKAGVPQLRIHGAVAVDAAGRTQAVAMNYDARAHRMDLTVPAGWLAEARYPVMVDPTIGAPFASGAISTVESNGVHSTLGGRFLTTSGATGQFRNSSDGSPAGASFAVPGGSTVSYNTAVNKYCFAYATYDADGEDCIGVVLLDPVTGTLSAEATMATIADTDDVDFDFWTTCVSATSTGWVVAFNCEMFDWLTDAAAWQIHAVRVSGAGGYSAGPSLVREVVYDWFTDDHDYDWWPLEAATVSTGGIDYVCVAWGDYAYIDTLAGRDDYDMLAGVVNAATMAIERDWIVESVSVSYDSDSWASAEDPNVAANDTNDQFLYVWDRANYDGWYSVKAHRYDFDGAGMGADVFIKGSGGSTGPDYYNGDVVWSPIVPGATNGFFATWNSGGNVYGAILNGGASVVTTNDITVGATGVAESSYLMGINKADTHILIAESVAGVASIQMFELVTVAAPPIIDSGALPGAVYGVAYSAVLSYAGGSGIPAWTQVGNNLPPGLTLNGATGEISGVATGPNGGYTFTVQLDATGTDTEMFTITVTGTPAATSGGGGGGGGGGGCASGSGAGSMAPAILAVLMLALVRMVRK